MAQAPLTPRQPRHATTYAIVSQLHSASSDSNEMPPPPSAPRLLARFDSHAPMTVRSRQKCACLPSALRPSGLDEALKPASTQKRGLHLRTPPSATHPVPNAHALVCDSAAPSRAPNDIRLHVSGSAAAQTGNEYREARPWPPPSHAPQSRASASLPDQTSGIASEGPTR